MAGKRALVTGSEGFVGRILCEYLTASGVEALGCDLSVPFDSKTRHACDLADSTDVQRMLEWAGPCAYVFHLAAAASVAAGIHAPGTFMRANIEGTVNLCEAMRALYPGTRLIFIGSSEVYGPPEYLPVDESHPLNPINPYAISKLAAEQYCQYLHTSSGMNVVLLRPFNHSGPGQRDQFVLSSFARQIVEIEKGLRKPILRVGNLTAKRDFSHVRDVVRAYLLAAEKGHAGEIYNICSGASVSIGEALETMRSLTDAAFTIESDLKRFRPVDVPEMLGSYEKFYTHTGWRPETDVARILADLVAYWRSTV